MTSKNLVNKKFGRLTVVERLLFEGRKDAYWRCICDCGDESVQNTYNLNKGRVVSCGCYRDESARLRFLKFDKILNESFLEREYVKKGRSLRNISKEVGCSATCLKKYLDKYNIPVFNRTYDIINQRFGKLLVLKRLPNENTRQSRWLCQCDCGNQTNVKGHSLVRGRIKSCGCLKHEVPKNFTGHGQLSGKYWSRVKRGAIERDLPVDIAIQDAWCIFKKQNGRCAISKLPIELKRSGHHTASLDRIDSNKGYIKDNVQWVHVDVQKLKNSFSEKKLFFLCKTIVDANQL